MYTQYECSDRGLIFAQKIATVLKASMCAPLPSRPDTRSTTLTRHAPTTFSRPARSSCMASYTSAERGAPSNGGETREQWLQFWNPLAQGTRQPNLDVCCVVTCLCDKAQGRPDSDPSSSWGQRVCPLVEVQDGGAEGRLDVSLALDGAAALGSEISPSAVLGCAELLSTCKWVI